MNKLSQMKIVKATKPGLYADGGNLYLQITVAGAKSWLFRYMRAGKARGMGLGPIHTIGLAEARARALDCRRQLFDGIDPINARDAERAAARVTVRPLPVKLPPPVPLRGSVATSGATRVSSETKPAMPLVRKPTPLGKRPAIKHHAPDPSERKLRRGMPL
jgi:hypothetical protein